MWNQTKRLEELLGENKVLYDEITEYKKEMKKLKEQIFNLDRDRRGVIEQLSVQKKENSLLNKELQAKDKLMNEREKILKNEINRMDLFKNKLLGCKKDVQLSSLKTEFNNLNKKNIILLRILNELIRIVGGDSEVFNQLLEISDEHDCSLLEEYLESLKQLKGIRNSTSDL